MKTLVTETTTERQGRMIAAMEKEPLRLAGSAVTACPECGTRFPDTGGGHWIGHCLLHLRRAARHPRILFAQAGVLSRISAIEARVERDGPWHVKSEHGLLDDGRPEFRIQAWDDTRIQWRPDGRRRWR